MRGISEFLKDDSGSETVQFVLFVPVFAAVLVIVTDASFLYLNHTEVWNVARDTARRMAVGQLTSEQEAIDYASSRITMFDNQYQVSASYDPDTKMAVLITVQIADAMIFGKYLQPIMGQSIGARFEMRSEPEIATGGGGGAGGCREGCSGGGFFDEVSAGQVGHGMAPVLVGGWVRTVGSIAAEYGSE